jgi:N-acetylmuramoyl-L-alanine amidase
MLARRAALISALSCSAMLIAACTSSTSGSHATSSADSSSTAVSSSAIALAPSPTPTPTPTSSSATPSKTPTTSAHPTPTHTSAKPTHASSTPPAPSVSVTVPAGTGPIIVIDPGHSVTVHGIDPSTGLDVSDYENEPEMRDVYAVALLVKSKLETVGYRVIMTKTSLDEPTTLGKRADIANAAHAALALSIHDQAGSNGGLPFASRNNTVYYQSVGTYRETPSGKKVYFTNTAEAALSKKYGEIFAKDRASQEGHSITLNSNVGYNLGGRGLPAGNIWMVQLLSKVPWIYNEAGGNSPGMSGLDATDKTRYADGLVASIEACVPVK